MKSRPIYLIMLIFLSISMTYCTKKQQGPSDLTMAPIEYRPAAHALQCDGRIGKQHTRTILHPLKNRNYLQQIGTYNEDGPIKIQWKNKVIEQPFYDPHNQMVSSYNQTYEKSSCLIIQQENNIYFIQKEKTLIIPKNLGEKFAGSIEASSESQYLRFHIKKLVPNDTGYLLHGFIEDDTIVANNKTYSATKNVDDHRDMSLLNILAVGSPVYSETVAAIKKTDPILSNFDTMGFTPQRIYGWVEQIGLTCNANDNYIFKDSLRKLIVLKVTTIP
jgi:hypothetical protein